MKKLKISGASVLIIFVLVFYNFSIVTSETYSSGDDGEHGYLEVIKEVFFDGAWTEGPIEPSIGDTLEFKITMTYHNSSGLPKKHWAFNIRVNDSFPTCLDYVIGSVDTLNGFSWSDDPNEYMIWDFGDQPLYEEESIVIKYNATVVQPTDTIPQKNNVTVLWDEWCTFGKDIIGFDSLTITIGVKPELNLIKRVWNPVTHQYVNSISSYEGETLHFRIDVNNNGPIDLTGVVVNDIYPEFLTPFEYSIPPFSIDPSNRIITWHLGTIPAQDSVVILFNATVENVGMLTFGKNIANVTCVQELFDTDNVTITIEKHFTIDKKVRHPDTGEWVEEIPYVKGCDPIRFRINITYYGVERMKCLLAYDQLPIDCLNYSNNVYIEIAGQEITPSDVDFYPDIYTEGDLFIHCTDPVEVPEGGVYFSWINQSIAGGLENGESVIIEFDASVIEYCECVDGEDCCVKKNCAEAWLWSCCDFVYYAKDCVNITCIALPGEFDKTVSLEDPTNWVKDLHTVQGHTIKFKLELTYYGNENLTNVSFLDILPCCLEYKDTIQSPTGTVIEVSPNKKTIWWNITKDISDCETVTIVFRVAVTGSSECGGCINNAYVYGYIWEQCDGLYQVVDRTDNATIFAEANSPPCAPDVSGPKEGVPGVTYSFKAMLDDPNGDQIYYMFSWGDATSDWLGPVSSGEVTQTHAYNNAGTFSIKAKAKDEHGAESDWTEYPWTIEIKTAEVEISLKMFHWRNVTAEVTNTGEADLSNVQWEFNISRDSILAFRDINVNGNGNIANLPVGGSEAITSEPIGFKLGMVDVTVTVTKTGVLAPTTITARAFVIGPIVIILPQ